MSRDYLREQTIDPAKRLGRVAGLGIAAGLVFGFTALFGALAVYALSLQLLGEGVWWTVLARGITTVVAFGIAGLIGWRLTKND